jgi:CBS-domain-containing membrane protein
MAARGTTTPAGSSPPPTACSGCAVLALRAADLMSTDVVSVGEEDSVLHAASLMQLRQVDHVPVMRGNAVVGMLDALSVAAAMPGSWRALQAPVKTVMRRDIAHARPDTPLAYLSRSLGYSRSGAVAVTDTQARLVGIVTRTDVLNALAHVEQGDE